MRKYENYKDSGIEWIGEIPSHWEKSRLCYLGEFTSSGIDKKINPEESLVKIINFTDIYKNKNHILDNNIDYMVVSAPENKIKQHLVKKGDLIFLPSSETYEDLGLSALVNEELENTSFSYHVINFRISPDMNHEFKKYLTNNNFVLNQFAREGQGTTRKIIGRNVFRNIKVPIPPIEEQTAIANYLDQKTSQIDDFIAKKERLIQLLEEERTAIINQAVTKGLDPGVPMKDSGVEWLGEIPAHWELKSFRFCIDILTDYTANGSFASLAENVTYFDTGYSRLVRLTDLRVDLVNEGLYVDEHAHNFLKKSELFGGEILIANVGAYAGLVMQMPLKEGKFTLGPNMFLVRLNQNTEFFLCQLNAPFCAEQLKMMSVSSAQPKLNKENIRQLKVVTPPIEEQNLIANHILKEKNRIETIAVKTQQEIELLKEYKTALISEVVTGKMDVRNS
jgi:type I restriction enzyme S subunit